MSEVFFKIGVIQTGGSLCTMPIFLQTIAFESSFDSMYLVVASLDELQPSWSGVKVHQHSYVGTLTNRKSVSKDWNYLGGA